MKEYSRILIEKYCTEHRKRKLARLVEMSYDPAAEASDADALYLEKLIDQTDDEELNAFLFSLGCSSGETITVIAHRKGGCTVSIKDSRYNIDTQLAEAIEV